MHTESCIFLCVWLLLFSIRFLIFLGIVCISSSFLYKAKITLYTHVLFSCWIFGCFPSLGYFDKNCCKYSRASLCARIFHSLWQKILKVELLGHIVLTLLRNCPTGFQSVDNIPISSSWDSQLLQGLTNICYVHLSNFIYLCVSSVVSHADFNLNFPDD